MVKPASIEPFLSFLKKRKEERGYTLDELFQSPVAYADGWMERTPRGFPANNDSQSFVARMEGRLGDDGTAYR